jgi:hypothetical protein
MLRKKDRLTIRDPKTKTADLLYKDESIPCRRVWFCPNEGPCTGKPCDLSIVIEKLAAYEDTRMTPEEVIAMKEREKRRRNKNNGKLLKQR